MKTAERFPKFAAGWIVIDTADAPRLANAIGSRIWRRRTHAVAFAEKSRVMRSVPDMRRIQVVPVDGPNQWFAVDYIDADDVTVRPDGQIRMSR